MEPLIPVVGVLIGIFTATIVARATIIVLMGQVKAGTPLPHAYLEALVISSSHTPLLLALSSPLPLFPP